MVRLLIMTMTLFYHVVFDGVIALIIKMTVSWDVTSYRLEVQHYTL
jgi:hypothetical protein